MLIYYLPVIFGFFGVFFFRESKLYFSFCCVVLFFLLGMKGDVDKDYNNYLYLFDLSPVMGEGFFEKFQIYIQGTGIEVGFLLVNSILKTLGFGLTALYVLFAFLSVGLIYYLGMSLGRNRFVVYIFLYVICFLGLWVQIRFGFAFLCSIVFCVLFVERRYFTAFCVFIISFGIHAITIAIVLPVLVYVICAEKYASRLKMIGVSILCGGCMLVIDMQSTLGVAMGTLNSRYNEYADDLGNPFSFLYRLALFVFVAMLVEKRRHYSTRMELMFYCLAFSSVIVWSLAWQIGILYRLGSIFESGFFFFLAVSNYASKYKFILSAVVIFAVFGARFVVSVDELLPYSLVF